MVRHFLNDTSEDMVINAESMCLDVHKFFFQKIFSYNIYIHIDMCILYIYIYYIYLYVYIYVFIHIICATFLEQVMSLFVKN